MDIIKNIYYECNECNFICKTKKEIIKHIKETKCENNNTKMIKKYKNNNNISDIDNNNDNDNDNHYNDNKIKCINSFITMKRNDKSKQESSQKLVNNLQFVAVLNKEIPELNITIKKEAYESYENFFNPDCVEPKIFYFLIDKIIITYFMYLYDNQFNSRELSFYEKSAILEIIKNRYNYYMNIDIDDLYGNDMKRYSESELRILYKFKEDSDRLGLFEK